MPNFLSLIHRRKSTIRNQINRVSAFILPKELPPLLALPREIRDMIYSYLLPTSRLSPVLPARHTGFTSISAPAPPLYLQLTCRQLCTELMDTFYAIAVFQVGSVNPHGPEWRSDPNYEFLAASPHLPRIRHLKILIGLDRMSMRTGYDRGIKFVELSPNQSVDLVCERAETLSTILKDNAQNLRTVRMDWWDDFGYGEEAERGRVFKQFQALEDVRWKRGNVQAFNKIKKDVKREVEKGLKELDEGKFGG